MTTAVLTPPFSKAAPSAITRVEPEPPTAPPPASAEPDGDDDERDEARHDPGEWAPYDVEDLDNRDSESEP